MAKTKKTWQDDGGEWDTSVTAGAGAPAPADDSFDAALDRAGLPAGNTAPVTEEVAKAIAAPIPPAPPAPAAPRPMPAFDTSQGTIIGSTLVVRGRLKSDENLVVRGRIEAEVHSTKDLRVETSGIINANLSVRAVWISGIVVGDIEASELVELAPDARVVGDIHTPRLIIHDGARFRGAIEMDGLQGLERVRPQPARVAVKEVKVAPPPVPVAVAVAKVEDDD
ncbi:MAG: polymer-forming cytoskeletal protein, partial [Myxococcota bacterium]